MYRRTLRVRLYILYKGWIVFFFSKIFNPKKHYYIHIYVYVRKKKKKKKITLSFRTCCAFRFGVKQSRPSPAAIEG